MFGDIHWGAKYTELPQIEPHSDLIIKMEEGKAQEDKSSNNRKLEQQTTINEIGKKSCQNSCCKNKSNVGARPTSKGNAILPLSSRCVTKKPFIPQSYHYKDFQKNQECAIGQKSLKSTVEIIQQVFSKSLNPKTGKAKNLVTNPEAIVNSRFFPVTVGLDTEEERIAFERDVHSRSVIRFFYRGAS